MNSKRGFSCNARLDLHLFSFAPPSRGVKRIRSAFRSLSTDPTGPIAEALDRDTKNQYLQQWPAATDRTRLPPRLGCGAIAAIGSVSGERYMADQRLLCERFPRSSNYHPEWVLAGVSSAANALWLTEWLCEALTLRPGMRVLDLGCGRAMSSIFLRREFGVQVWGVDLWFNPSENIQRIRDA